MSKLSKKKRVIRRYPNGANCFYCENFFTTEFLTIDHIIPTWAGGTNNNINLVPCCKKCNKKKGGCHFSDLELLQFKELRRKGQGLPKEWRFRRNNGTKDKAMRHHGQKFL